MKFVISDLFMAIIHIYFQKVAVFLIATNKGHLMVSGKQFHKKL